MLCLKENKIEGIFLKVVLLAGFGVYITGAELPCPHGLLVAVGTDTTVHIGALPVPYTVGLAWDMTLTPNPHNSSSSHATD